MTVTQPVIELLNPGDPGIAVWARIHFDLDLATETGARATLRAICAVPVSDRLVIVEFGPCRFVAVSGLRVLLDAAEMVRVRGGELVVVNPPLSLRRMHALFRIGSAVQLLDRAAAASLTRGLTRPRPARRLRALGTCSDLSRLPVAHEIRGNGNPPA